MCYRCLSTFYVCNFFFVSDESVAVATHGYSLCFRILKLRYQLVDCLSRCLYKQQPTSMLFSVCILFSIYLYGVCIEQCRVVCRRDQTISQTLFFSSFFCSLSIILMLMLLLSCCCYRHALQ